MSAGNASRDKARRQLLIHTYAGAPQFGLVLGAGVTVLSHVPVYNELALRLLELASDKGKLSVPTGWVHDFAHEQRELIALRDRRTVPPEEVVQFVRMQLGNNRRLLRGLTRDLLYQQSATARIVAREVFEKNSTLDAILTFCAARSGTALAPSVPPAEARRAYAIETNRKIGGILTTNYDNLLEGAFHTKYRRNLLRPVGRPSSQETARDRRLIPVYHIHGYVGYREAENPPDEVQSPDIVITEDDYFRAFYDPLGFGAYVTMDFLRRFPCLFIGSAMTDRNLRRFLYHLARDSAEVPPHQRRFAILPSTGAAEEYLTDSVLLSYGVEVIWIQDFGEIRELLRDLYTAVQGVSQADWDYVEQYRW